MTSAYMFRLACSRDQAVWAYSEAHAASSVLSVMDAWEVDPPGWEPQWYRPGADTGYVWRCPGCDWQAKVWGRALDQFTLITLEHAIDGGPPPGEDPLAAATELATGHRRDCPTLDFLAALARNAPE